MAGRGDQLISEGLTKHFSLKHFSTKGIYVVDRVWKQGALMRRGSNFKGISYEQQHVGRDLSSFAQYYV